MVTKKKQELPMMIVSGRVKSFVKEASDNDNTRCSGEFVDAVNEELADMLTRAAERCAANKRSTLRPADL
jgi:histone H3/H4